eukprot:COSAG06_NODE_7236_length_2577_cov_1.755448_3_plen_152_part_00
MCKRFRVPELQFFAFQVISLLAMTGSFHVVSRYVTLSVLCSGLAQAVHSRVAIASQLRLDCSHRALHTQNTVSVSIDLSSCIVLSLSCFHHCFHQWLANNVAFTPFDCLAPSPSLPTGRGPSPRSASRGWLSRQTPARPRLRPRQRQHPLP